MLLSERLVPLYTNAPSRFDRYAKEATESSRFFAMGNPLRKVLVHPDDLSDQKALYQSYYYFVWEDARAALMSRDPDEPRDREPLY